VYGKSQTPSFSGVNYPALKTETKIRIMKWQKTSQSEFYLHKTTQFSVPSFSFTTGKITIGDSWSLITFTEHKPVYIWCRPQITCDISSHSYKEELCKRKHNKFT
jgi:hypothetical protein